VIGRKLTHIQGAKDFETAVYSNTWGFQNLAATK